MIILFFCLKLYENPAKNVIGKLDNQFKNGENKINYQICLFNCLGLISHCLTNNSYFFMTFQHIKIVLSYLKTILI